MNNTTQLERMRAALLTDEQIDIAIQNYVDPVATYGGLHSFARAIEQAVLAAQAAEVERLVKERDRAEQTVREVLRDCDEDELMIPALGDLLSYLSKQNLPHDDLYNMVKDTGKLIHRLKDELYQLRAQLAEHKASAGWVSDELQSNILDLFGEYWNWAYKEGSEGANYAEEANDCLVRLERLLSAPQPPAEPELEKSNGD